TSRWATESLGVATVAAHPACQSARRRGPGRPRSRGHPADVREASLPHRARRRSTTTATIGIAVAALGVGLLSSPPATAATSAAAAAPGEAPGSPGAMSHFDLARKDCVGTARNRSSKVWYTVAGGVLSDVYYPTVDNTNVETLQYVVTDGTT